MGGYPPPHPTPAPDRGIPTACLDAEKDAHLLFSRRQSLTPTLKITREPEAVEKQNRNIISGINTCLCVSEVQGVPKHSIRCLKKNIPSSIPFRYN